MSPDVRAALVKMNRDERLELLDEVWALVRDDALPGERWEDVRDRLRGDA